MIVRAPDIHVEEAFSGANLFSVQDLCRSFRLWLFERYPEDRDKIDAYYNPHAYERLLADLPVLHGPPDGTILLAKVGSVACGCVMLSRVDATRCEMKRLFVDPGQRGTGAGRALCETLLTSAKTIGYETMMLDTGPLIMRRKRSTPNLVSAPAEPTTIRATSGEINCFSWSGICAEGSSTGCGSVKNTTFCGKLHLCDLRQFHSHLPSPFPVHGGLPMGWQQEETGETAVTNFTYIITPTLFAVAAFSSLTSSHAELSEGVTALSPGQFDRETIFVTVHVDQHHGSKRLREPRRYRPTRRRQWNLEQRRFTGDHCLVRYGRQLSPSRYCYPRYNKEYDF